ncbi:MAG: L-2-hydroxyglutarate oxidase [Verrucomicrobia bacterium]|nr:L-2-hydroxyglutarate oxidase [Verrucomicrobiota bacterium]MDE3098670.1 L-2-hydroxyglutarate oxidase [Verrucomicrobiota bacterium]
MNHDVIVVGGGIVGLATAFRLLEARPGLKVLLLEKEARLAAHQTGHNSGVLHSGLYYKPGSEKARLSVTGLQQMLEFCRRHGIAHDPCGKIVVATHEEELPRLEKLWERGNANGLAGLRKLTPAEIREIEPHAAGIAAIHVPQEGIVDYPAVCEKLAELIRQAGGEIRLNTRVLKMIARDGGRVVETSAGEFRCKCVVTCGGLHSDRLVKASGQAPSAKVIPFRGEYYCLRKKRQFLVRNLIYPVPDPKFPFLGVHFTRLIHGGVEAGPNAVLALAREGYSWTDFHWRDAVESLSYPGLWKFLARYPRVTAYEIRRSLSRTEFLRSLQRLVPEIRGDDMEPGGSGVRAQAMTPDGRLVEDFCFEEGAGALHVINAPSPAATASLAIGRHISARVLETLK